MVAVLNLKSPFMDLKKLIARFATKVIKWKGLISNVAIFQLDGTYRITLNNFPLSVFGRSDINRIFFPIALALMSQEKADDILAFLRAITKVCKDFNINFVVRFYMIDAAPE